jgi:hypothetical protein
MKYFAAALCTLLLTGGPACARPSVEVERVVPSSQKPVITVLKEGAEQQGAKLTVLAQNGKEKLVLATDARGTAKLPHLHPGTYCVVASTAPTLRADLCLQTAASHDRTTSAFTMELHVKAPPPPTFEEQLAAAEAAPVAASSCTFSGVVVDPSGSPIPHVLITIHKQRTHGAHPRKIFSDRQGHFAATPSPGRYTAVFSAQGFAIRFLTFEIARAASESALDVKLSLGAVTESVGVAGAIPNHQIGADDVSLTHNAQTH